MLRVQDNLHTDFQLDSIETNCEGRLSKQINSPKFRRNQMYRIREQTYIQTLIFIYYI